MTDPISNFFSWLGDISVPKAENLLTPKAAGELAYINAPLSREIATITGTVPPKATTPEMISGYLTQGVSFLNSVSGILSSLKPAAAQITTPAKVITVGGTPTGSAVSTVSPQVNLPDNVIVLPGQVSTQGAQTVQQQDFSWVIWLIVALLVLGGIVILTKGK